MTPTSLEDAMQCAAPCAEPSAEGAPVDRAPLAAMLARYAPLVDDFDALLDYAARPLPRVLWANPLRAPVAHIEARVRARCPQAVALGWRPHTWRLPAEAKPGLWPEFLMGLVHVQEEAALWAGDLVGAEPGQRVLDLCAAPGNKTAQIAVQMGDRGTLVANERSRGRLPSLRRALERLGVSCAAVSQGDGARLSGQVGLFDHALVDVPCSCEGTSRKRGGRAQPVEDRFRMATVQVQTALLRRAVQLVKPGGTIVYATCTYAPEENEGVLDSLAPELAHIEPIEAPAGLKVCPGITQWQGRSFRPDVAHAARLWPHHNDTGGFFVAKLRRL